MTDATPIEDLDLTVRTYNGLRRGGIRTLEELTTRTRRDLLDLSNFGAKSLDEITEKLQAHGLQLGTCPDGGRCAHYDGKHGPQEATMTADNFFAYDSNGSYVHIGIDSAQMFGQDIIRLQAGWTRGGQMSLLLDAAMARGLAAILTGMADKAGDQAGEQTAAMAGEHGDGDGA